MRKALNENPMVQLAVLAVCGVAFAVILFTSVLKKDEPAATPATDPATATSSAPVTDPSVAAAPAADPAAAAPPAGTAAPGAAGSAADGLLPSKGLPEGLLVAFAKNKTIALLVVDPKRFADKKVERYTDALRSRDDLEVFVVNVRDIAKYARVTAGVSVSRTPALVVIRPRKLTGSVPTATVSYGFRGPRSVSQAIDDALYKGKQIPAYP